MYLGLFTATTMYFICQTLMSVVKIRFIHPSCAYIDHLPLEAAIDLFCVVYTTRKVRLQRRPPLTQSTFC